MSEINQDIVKKIAFLSRLRIEDDKLEKTADEFNSILDWMSQLSEVDTDNVEPLVAVNDQFVQLREDEVTDGNIMEEVLENAPSRDYEYFAVPKFVD